MIALWQRIKAMDNDFLFRTILSSAQGSFLRLGTTCLLPKPDMSG